MKFLASYRRGECFILVHHYREYFSDWEREITRKALYCHPQEALAFIDTHPNVWKTTLTEVVEWLVSNSNYDPTNVSISIRG